MDFEEIVREDEGQWEEARSPGGCWLGCLRLLLFLLLPLLVVVGALPTIFSAEGGRRWALERINAAVPGELSFASWRLGWLRAPELTEFAYAQDGVQVKAKRVRFDRGLLRLLPIGTLNLGEVTLEEGRVEVSWLPQAERVPEKKGKSKESKGGFFLPIVDVAAKLKVVQGRVGVSGATREEFLLEQIDGEVALSSWRKPIAVQTRAALGGGQVALEGSVHSLRDLFTERREKEAEKLALTLEDVDVTAFRPLLSNYAEAPTILGGKLEGTLSALLNGKELGEVEGGLAVAQLELATSEGKRVRCGDIALLANFNYDKQSVNVTKFEVNSPWLRAQVLGRLQEAKERGRWTGAINGRATIGLAAVARDFGALMGLAPELQVDGGELRLNVEVSGGAKSLRLQTDAVAAGLALRVEGKPFELKPAPSLECKMELPYAGVPEFEVFHLKAPFLDFYGKGRYDATQIKVEADLTRFARDARKIVKSLPPMVGLIYLDVASRRDKAVAAFNCFAKLTDVAVELAPRQMMIVPQGSFKFDGKVPIKEEQPQREVREAVYELKLPNGRAAGSWQRLKMGEGTSLELRKFVLNSDLELGSLRRLLGGFIPVDLQRQLADWQGRAVVNATAEAVGGALKAHLNAAGLEIVGKVDDGVWRVPDARFEGTLARATVDQPLTVDLRGQGSAMQERAGTVVFAEPAVGVVLKCAVAADGDGVEFTQLDLLTSVAEVEARGSLSDPGHSKRLKLGGKLKVDMVGVSHLLAMYGVDHFRFTGKEARTFSFNAPLAGGLASILAEGEAVVPVFIASGKGLGLEAGAADLRLELGRGILAVAYEPSLNGGRLRLGPRIAVGGKGGWVCEVPARTRLLDGVKITQEMVDTWLANMNPLFYGAKILDGAVTLEARGFRYDPRVEPERGLFADLDVRLDNLKLEHGSVMLELLSKIKVNQRLYEVKELPAHVVVRSGAVAVDPVRMFFDRQPVVLGGSVTFDGKINYLIEVPVTEQMVGKAAGGMLKGATIKIPVTGTVDHPRLDTRALLKMIGGALGESIKEQTIDRVSNFLEQLQRDLRK